jgi:hypothetical protein
MEELSSNSEPGGSRPAGSGQIARREAAVSMLIFGEWSRVTGNVRGLSADWIRGGREARPGLI